MGRMIFVNLPVKDLPRSMSFFSALGFEFNPQFTNDKAACMVITEDHNYAMLLSEPFFQGFIKKPIADASKATEVLICLSCESREEVDELVAKALAAGGTAPNPKQDHGFMYSHGFEDPDGHVWEVMWMDPKAVQPG
ncbi:VOC family protein [Ramlibacter sp.]|uniref:VOC family protein n=1 Tax=Ramlibacter sp. TaxID=1917967 RepID=UPI003D13C0AD